MIKSYYALLLASSILIVIKQQAAEITPYKFTDREAALRAANYTIPDSSRFVTQRADPDSPDIIYYLSKSQTASYPITILCGGSSSKNDIGSIIHIHRYFLQELLDLGVGTLTIEQWGVDGTVIDKKEFMDHYTRSQRLQDHRTVIEHLKTHPPVGWNGRLIFIGCSEGGPLVTTLTTEYSEMTVATINWCGAGDWSWREELWSFIGHAPWFIKLWYYMPRWMPFSPDVPKTRDEYDQRMDETLAHPDTNKWFLGMTYQYHADALLYPPYEYAKIRTF